jgi:hypothetical protein
MVKLFMKIKKNWFRLSETHFINFFFYKKIYLDTKAILNKKNILLKKNLYIQESYKLFYNLNFFNMKDIIKFADHEKTSNHENFFINPCLNPKDYIWNDLIYIIFFTLKLGNILCLSKENISLLVIFTDSIWVLNKQYDKFWKRKIHGGKITLPPELFLSFFSLKDYSFTWSLANNNYVFKQIKRLKNTKLIEISLSLEFFSIAVLYKGRSSIFFDQILYQDALMLSASLISYANYNNISLKRIEKNHSRILLRDQNSNIKLKTIEPRKNIKGLDFNMQENIIILANFLKSIGEYQMICLDPFLPTDLGRRRKFLQKIGFPFPIELLEYVPGGNKKKILKCWRIPFILNQRSSKKTEELVRLSKKEFPIYLSRKMRTIHKNIRKT